MNAIGLGSYKYTGEQVRRKAYTYRTGRHVAKQAQ